MFREMKRGRRAAFMGSAATLLASFALSQGIAPAYAQDDDSLDDAVVEEIVVTGTRIKNANLSSPSPVTVLGGEAISARGTTQIEDILTTLPQTVAAVGDGDFAGSGVAQVDLRGLGAARTLVLIDGHRMPFGQANETAADLNSIPAALVSRVEILTGGASAVYGADAVAGVVNFIMKRDFEGLQVTGQLSINQADNDSERFADILRGGSQPVPGSVFDGFTYSFDAIMGTNIDGDRGNITIAFNYRETNEIRQNQRDFSACAFGGGDPEFFCLGSSTTRPARITDFGVLGATGGVSFDLLAFDEDTGQTRDFVGGGTPNDTFNFASTQRTRSPSERFGISLFSHYELNDWAEFYMDAAFTSNVSVGQIGPSADFFETDQLNCDNPFFSAIMLDEICTQNGLSGDDIAFAFVGRRNIEGGPRQFVNSNDTFRINGGIRGDLNDVWSFDLHGQFSRVKNSLVRQNFVDPVRAQKALLIVTDPATGNAVCKSFLDGSDLNCVPWNIFQPGGITDEAIDYIEIPTLNSGRVSQKILMLTVSGDLGEYGFTLPGAETGVQFVAGIERRLDHLERRADVTLIEQGFQNISKGVDVSEFFAELAIPILEGHAMAEELTMTAAFRWSDYSTTGPSNTWALGLTWQPVPDIRFRAQAQQAVRAPNIFELFNDRGPNLFDLVDENGDGIFDPCAGATPFFTAAQCANQGVTAAQFGNVVDNPAGQFNSITGGNPDLDVERSRTYTIGAVITPEAVPGLTLSVDYYSITVKDFIGQVPPGLAINKCALENDPFFCSLIQRDAGGGLFVDPDTSFVIGTNLNTGSLKTKGLDINLDYGMDLPDGFGSLNFTAIANYLFSFKIESLPGETPFDCAGFYSGDCVVPRPTFGMTSNVTWTSEGGIAVGLTWRYIGSTTLFGSTSTENKAFRLKTINYFDIAATTEVAEGFRIRLGINNFLGTRPPITNSVPAGLGTGNTFPGFYDVDIRFAFVSLTADF